MPSRTHKLAPKKQRQIFLTKVTAMLLDLGAEPGDFDFALQTKAGLLKIHPTENQAEGLGTVFTRFQDPKAARELVCCNPYSRQVEPPFLFRLDGGIGP